MKRFQAEKEEDLNRYMVKTPPFRSLFPVSPSLNHFF